MAPKIKIAGIAACAILVCTTTPSRAGISISIGARWGIAHPVIITPPPSPHEPDCRPHYPPTPPRHRGIEAPHHWQRHWPTPIVTPHWPRPVILHPTSPAPSLAISIWITNSNGSKSKVTLTRRGNGYVGPRKEYYAHMPTHEQLRMVYGF